ncbi:CD1375 family protein [Falseniella ignava]|nr:CD1375 family protein [Falseniella ignava]
MAKFLAVNIINGKYTFDRVPKFLKEKVKEILIDMGAEDLITE